MSEQRVSITAWIRRVAALIDSDLEEELRLVNKNSLIAFTRAIGRIRRPELEGSCIVHLLSFHIFKFDITFGGFCLWFYLQRLPCLYLSQERFNFYYNTIKKLH